MTRTKINTKTSKTGGRKPPAMHSVPAASAHPLLTVEEVCKALSMTVTGIRRLVHRQGFPVVRLNARVWRFRREDLDTWTSGA